VTAPGLPPVRAATESPPAGDTAGSSPDPGRAPVLAAGWTLGYGALQAWWAAGSTPAFGVLGTDLLVAPGWGAVAVCLSAAGCAAMHRWAPWHRAVALAGWAAAAVLALSSSLLLIDVVGRLLPGLGLPFDRTVCASRAAALLGAVLLARSAFSYRRRRPGVCPKCLSSGLVHRRGDRLPSWARRAALAAVTACLVRVVAQIPIGTTTSKGTSGVLFEAGFALAGVALPLALLRSWRRDFPPRWPVIGGWPVVPVLLLPPAFAVSAGLVGYFGIGTVQLATETLTGTGSSDTGLPPAFFWVAMPAYVVWGTGLGAVALARYARSRPHCPTCGH